MPTGYTEAIGRGVSFKEFVLLCARGMGALITMRDDPWDAPIPDEFKPSDYHQKELVKAQDRLTILNSLSLAAADKMVQDAYMDALRSHEDSRQKNRELESKYREMLRRVEAWEPPTPDHQGLKKFMMEQINQSIDFDCGYNPKRPTLKSPQDWLTEEKGNALRDIEYHTREKEAEERRSAERTKWVQALKKSLEVNL